MNTAGYVVRHFRQVRRTLFLCIVLTCTTFVLMAGPFVLPIYDNTRGAIIEEGGLTKETPIFKNENFRRVNGNSHADIVVENINYEARMRYHGASVRKLINDRSPNSGMEVLMGQFRTVDEMSIKMNFIGNNRRNNNTILNQFQLNNNNNRKFVKNMNNNNNNKKGSFNQRFEIGNRLFHNLNQNPEQMFAVWKESLQKACDGNLNLYSSQFARLKDVTVDRQFCVAKAKGGEDIDKVLHQDENAEFYTMWKGCFQLTCPTAVPYYYFLGNINYLNQWVQSISSRTPARSSSSDVISTFTIAIGRSDYANLYWTMNDWYATFLMTSFFEQSPTTTNILLVDAHPKGNLDPVWSTLFQSATRFSDLPLTTTFTDMVWGLQGYNSILNQHVAVGHAPPMIPEFRQFVLSRFKLEETRPVNCSEISVLFLWRRDYLAHPRNPQGRVQRKIFNEQELVDGIKSLHPTYKVQGIQMDLLSMEDQLKLIVQADILIGMHGAGLAHVLMLQQHAAMVELIPSYYGTENNHFADLARWSGVSYIKWVNLDYRNERPNFNTIVPLSVIDGIIGTAVKHICSDRTSGQNVEPLYVINGINKPLRRMSQQFSQNPGRQYFFHGGARVDSTFPTTKRQLLADIPTNTRQLLPGVTPISR